MSSWGTVTLADEPPGLLLAFAAHHVAMGASEVHIFLDRPDPATATLLQMVPGVRVTQCDRAFWEANGGRRLKLQTKRQEIVGNLAYAQAGVEWLAHIDADEFLYTDGNLSAELSYLPSEMDAVLFPVRERVWRLDSQPSTIFDGLLRVPIPGKVNTAFAFYGPAARFLARGLSGHTAGKTIMRTGRSIGVGIHKPPELAQLTVLESSLTRVLHFDGLTPFHWIFKRWRYAIGPEKRDPTRRVNARHTLISELSEVPSFRGAVNIYQQAATLSVELEGTLSALGLIQPLPIFAPAAALKRLAPDAAADLSVEGFDAWIRNRNASLISALELPENPVWTD